MERALRLNLLNRNQALKTTFRRKAQELRREWRVYKKERAAQERVLRQAIKTERKNRREDWMCGPLAPMRDAGDQAGLYGTASPTLTRPPRLPSNIKPTGKQILFAVGDRVVVARGSEQGKIGEIADIDYESNTAKVNDINMVSTSLQDSRPLLDPVADDTGHRRMWKYPGGQTKPNMGT